MKRFILAGMIGIWATGTMAHSPLESTSPLNEEIVADMPVEILLDFKGDIRLTRVSMSYGEDESVDLDLSGHEGFITDYAIPLDAMGPDAMGSGDYAVAWRGLGVDGHALNGTFVFTVQ